MANLNEETSRRARAEAIQTARRARAEAIQIYETNKAGSIGKQSSGTNQVFQRNQMEYNL